MDRVQKKTMEDHLTYRSEEVIVGVQGMEKETQQEPTQSHPERRRECKNVTSNTMQYATPPEDVIRNSFFFSLRC